MDNLDQLVSAVRKIAAERPDVTYDAMKCRYDSGDCSDGSTGCLLGQALDSIDWPIYEDAVGASIRGLLSGEGYADDRADWCVSVQNSQDIGSRWGYCIEFADRNFIDIGES